MADHDDRTLTLDRIEDRSIVSLKIARSLLGDAKNRLDLAGPLEIAGSDPKSLWLGPDRWLLVSDSAVPDAMIESANRSLAGILHSAVDSSAGLAVFKMTGRLARTVLATGTGVDLRPDRFSAGTCCRTRLAGIAAVVSSDAPDQYDVYIDRCYENYLVNWLTESASICDSFSNVSEAKRDFPAMTA